MKNKLHLWRAETGFTLVEILVAVLIMAILITMAVPMYERTVEKSRVAEVSMTLKRLAESKLRTMDDRNIVNFTSGAFGINQLDGDFPASKDFTFSLYPSSYPNAVCAVRARGGNQGTAFLYLGEVGAEYCANSSSSVYSSAVCTAYRSEGRRLFCQNKSGTSSCDDYSLSSFNIGSCN